ncbi:MAG TPA: GNAT family N-acetyltransferase [Alphaproteobacteria bacterium]|nr:GNAT family N-acetyltransferase [Alphaproteobacteria bacterium]
MELTHDPKTNEFSALVEGQKCIVHYIVIDSNTLDIDHVFVPRTLQGKGVARQMMEQVVRFLEHNKVKVETSCEYAKKFFDDDRYRKYLNK